MKKLFIVIIPIFIAGINLVAQNTYRFQGKDIQLTLDSTMYYIQTTNEQSSTKRSAILKQQVQDGEIKSFHKLSNNRFLIVANKMQNELEDYISHIYRNEQKEIVMVLPRIVIMLKEGADIKVILKEYSGKIDIESGNRRKFILKCKISKSEDILKITNDLTNRLDVDWCEPELLSEIKLYNTLYPQQYYLNNTGQNGGTAGIDINVLPAWNITNGNSNIVVAVIDQGVDRNHEDIGNRVVDGYTIRNPLGLGAPQNENNLDSKGHGTACAGIIGASNNTIGIRGIASNINILPVNIVPDLAFIDGWGRLVSGFGSNIEIAQAINWAWHRADILSNSWGGNLNSNEIISAIDSARTYGRNGKGTIVVFASGNSYPNTPDVSFPGNVNGVITVGAINKSGTIWNYSQRGASMDLVAPTGNVNLQGDVTTTDRMGAFGYNNNGNYLNNFGGTSAACPQVAGVAALMLSANPDLTETQVRTSLQNTARDLGASGFDNTYGYGLVNASAALNAILPTISGPSELCTNQSGTFSVNLPTGATVSWQTNGLSTPANITYNSFTASSLLYAGAGYVRATVTIGQTLFTLQKDLVLNGYVPIEGPDEAYLSENKAYFTMDDGLTVLNWKINGQLVTPSNPHRLIVLLNKYYPGDVLITCTVSTLCGTFEASKSLIIIDDYEFLMYPNPTTDLLTVSLASPAKTVDNATIAQTVYETVEPYSIQLWNEHSGLVKIVETDKSTIQIPLHGLPKGMYYVHLIKDKNTVKKQILWIK
jgi:subtilisin family serine protease